MTSRPRRHFLLDSGEIRERYSGPSDIGPRSYAVQAIQVDQQIPETELSADAVDAVQRFHRTRAPVGKSSMSAVDLAWARRDPGAGFEEIGTSGGIGAAR